MSESQVADSVLVQSDVTFSQEDIDRAVAKIRSAGKSMARSIETLLVMSVYDSIVNESPAVANALISALRASTKKDGIVAFLETHGKLYNRGGKIGFAFFNLGAQEKLAWTKDYVESVQEAAQDWETFKPAPKAADDLDIVAALQAVVKKHDTAVKAGKPIINAELAAYIAPLIAQFTARTALVKAQAGEVAVPEAAVAA